jgi:hypothetical protein
MDPFTRCFSRCAQLPNEAAYRLQLAHRYSYVLPQPHLIALLALYSPLVELGAGTGYWAYLLRLAGVDIIAYDQTPLGGDRENRYHPHVRPWTYVQEGDATVLRAHAERTLFLCWPPVYSALGEALRFYSGNLVVYIGDHGRTTALPSLLETDFDRIERHPVLALDPAPDAVADLSVWRRRV